MTYNALADSRLTVEQNQVCRQAKVEHSKLDTAGLRKLLAKKPEQEATSLDERQLKDLRRLIELDAALMFKCRFMVHPDLNKSGPNTLRSIKERVPLDLIVPDLPTRKPVIAYANPELSTILPLPVRKPK